MNTKVVSFRYSSPWRTMRRPASRSSFIWLRLSAFGALLILAYVLTYRTRTERLRTAFLSSYSPNSADSCIGVHSGENVVVMVKTGASEAIQKVPAQMETTLRCAKHVLHFSDLEQDLGPYHMHDALDTVSASAVANNPDFDFYYQQQELWQDKRDISELKGVKNPESPDQLAAWTLDKYKFLHVLEKTWALKPDLDWYVLLDADSYIFWSNLLEWLGTMDPAKRSYFGSEVNIAGERFAHGGSGIVMSRAAVYQLVIANQGTAERWDPNIRARCCGDLVLGMAFKEYGIELQDTWPLMSGEKPSSMPFGPGTPEYMCSPALTMHHLSPADMRELAEFEQRRLKSSGPLTHVELFQSLVIPSIDSRRDNWDNLASDHGEFGKTGGVSLEAASLEECAQACEADMKCVQYSYHAGNCQIGMSVRLGHERAEDEEGIWQSGWNRSRLKDWMASQLPCDHIAFPAQDFKQ